MALKNFSLPMLLGSIAIGLLAAFLSVVYLKYQERLLIAKLKGPESEKIEVIVASVDLPKGAVLGGNNLAVRAVPVEYVQPNTVTPDGFESIDGKMLLQPMKKGRALLQNFVVDVSAKDFSDTIPEGHRAITFQVDELNAIGGHARPGNRIDIYTLLPASLKGRDVKDIDLENISNESISQLASSALNGANKVIIPVLQNVLVLATGERAYGEYEEKYSAQAQAARQQFQANTYTTLTIDVTPKQGALLAQAEEYGDIYTLLRNREDTKNAGFSEISPESLFSNAISMQTGGSMLVTAEGKLFDTSKMTKTKDGFYVTANGKVFTKDGKPLDGVTVTEDGSVVTSTGEVLTADDIVVNENGTVTRANGEAIAGVTAKTVTDTEVTPDIKVDLSKVNLVEFLAGGNSKDGVAIPGVLPVLGAEGSEFISGEANTEKTKPPGLIPPVLPVPRVSQ